MIEISSISETELSRLSIPELEKQKQELLNRLKQVKSIHHLNVNGNGNGNGNGDKTPPPTDNIQQNGNDITSKYDINDIWKKANVTPPKKDYAKRRRDLILDDIIIPEAAHHEFFDTLINNRIQEKLIDYDRELENDSKKKKLNDEIEKNDYLKITNDLNPKIQFENIFRLGGLTAFPVNDPTRYSNKQDTTNTNTEYDDRFLGLRFDIFSRYESKFLIPHYIILKKIEKNNSWSIFKTTIPKYIPLSKISNDYLNNDLTKFVSIIRKNLISIEFKKNIFSKLKDKLVSPSSLEHDLDFTKIKINLKDLLQIVIICSLNKIESVVTIPLRIYDNEIGGNGEDDPIINEDFKQKISISLRGSISEFEDRFENMINELGLH